MLFARYCISCHGTEPSDTLVDQNRCEYERDSFLSLDSKVESIVTSKKVF